MLIRTSHTSPGLLTRVWKTTAGLWFPEYGVVVRKHQNVLALLGTPEGRRLIPASNIVTNTGDLYYAQMSAGETVTTDDFGASGRMELATAGTPGKSATTSSFTLVTTSRKVLDASYPTTDDSDTDNTGAGTDIVTWLTSWTKSDFNQTSITHGLIHAQASPSASQILTGYAFAASFDKTADDTLKVFVNHTFNGI